MSKVSSGRRQRCLCSELLCCQKINGLFSGKEEEENLQIKEREKKICLFVKREGNGVLICKGNERKTEIKGKAGSCIKTMKMCNN